MKTIRLLIVTAFIIVSVSCNAQADKEGNKAISNVSDKIEMYYFHFTARCITCRTVEAEAKKNLEALYPEQVKKGLFTFHALNLDEESTRPVAEKLGVTGQTLMIVRGDQKVNITNEAFMYAVSKPEKFREIINDKVDGLMNR